SDVRSLTSVVSSFILTTTVPCLFCSETGCMRLIAAVVGLGADGRTCSPINALARDDFPALNAPNRAIVYDRLFSLSYFRFISSIIDWNPGKNEIVFIVFSKSENIWRVGYAGFSAG